MCEEETRHFFQSRSKKQVQTFSQKHTVEETRTNSWKSVQSLGVVELVEEANNHKQSDLDEF